MAGYHLFSFFLLKYATKQPLILKLVYSIDLYFLGIIVLAYYFLFFRWNNTNKRFLKQQYQI